MRRIFCSLLCTFFSLVPLGALSVFLSAGGSGVLCAKPLSAAIEREIAPGLAAGPLSLALPLATLSAFGSRQVHPPRPWTGTGIALGLRPLGKKWGFLLETALFLCRGKNDRSFLRLSVSLGPVLVLREGKRCRLLLSLPLSVTSRRSASVGIRLTMERLL